MKVEKQVFRMIPACRQAGSTKDFEDDKPFEPSTLLPPQRKKDCIRPTFHSKGSRIRKDEGNSFPRPLLISGINDSFSERGSAARRPCVIAYSSAVSRGRAEGENYVFPLWNGHLICVTIFLKYC